MIVGMAIPQNSWRDHGDKNPYRDDRQCWPLDQRVAIIVNIVPLYMSSGFRCDRRADGISKQIFNHKYKLLNSTFDQMASDAEFTYYKSPPESEF